MPWISTFPITKIDTGGSLDTFQWIKFVNLLGFRACWNKKVLQGACSSPRLQYLWDYRVLSIVESQSLNILMSLSFTFLAHLAFRPCELLSSFFVRRPSVNISHFNLLLRNHWANCNQTLVEWPPSKIVSGDPDFQPRWLPS